MINSNQSESKFTKQLEQDCTEMGVLLKDLDLRGEVERDEGNSSLYSPIHIGENDTKNMETECTDNSKREIPFLEIAQGFRF